MLEEAFFFLGRALTGETANEGQQERRRTHNIKFSCVEMKYSANEYLRPSLIEVLDL